MLQSNLTTLSFIPPRRLLFSGYSFAHLSGEKPFSHTTSAAADAHDHLAEHLERSNHKASAEHQQPQGLSIDFFKQFFQNLLNPTPEQVDPGSVERRSFIERIKSSMQAVIDWLKEAVRYLYEDFHHLFGAKTLHAAHDKHHHH